MAKSASYREDGSLFDIPRRYLESLAAQNDRGEASLFDLQTPLEALVVEPIAPPCSVMPYTLRVVNSSSKSSSSTELAVDFDQENNTKSHVQVQLKAKNSNSKKQWKRRFAFLTKTKVDYLEDGYKWKKYGKKPVKNNYFPRTYYQCTSESCGVKKTIERSLKDLSTLVTTYEGSHTHRCPNTHPEIMPQTATFGGRTGGWASSSHLPPLNYHHTEHLNFNLTNNNTTTTAFPSSFSYELQEGRYCPSPLPSYEDRDNGLLQDIMKPFQVRKEKS